MNYWGIGFCIGVFAVISAGLITLAIIQHVDERRRAKERKRRWRQPIREWWELIVDA